MQDRRARIERHARRPGRARIVAGAVPAALGRRHDVARLGGEVRQAFDLDADLAFHREIAHATGNEFINTFISFICERIRQSIHYARETNPIDSLAETQLAEHAAIYEAIVSGDPDTARLAMRRHFIGAAERVGINMTRTLHDRPLLNETRKVN